MNIWGILGIEKTTDKNAIVNAYRSRLMNVNPEEDQKGFMELRAAYEQALKNAAQPSYTFDDDYDDEDDEYGLSELDKWVKRLNDIYEKLATRLDEEAWIELFEEDICHKLDTINYVRYSLINFLTSHYFLPHKIWLIIEEYFYIEEDTEELSGIYEESDIARIVHKINNDDLIKPELLENGDDVGASYDVYLELLYSFKAMLDSEEVNSVNSILDELKAYGTHHIYEDILYARYLILKEEYASARERLVPLLKEFSDDMELLRSYAYVLKELGDFMESEETYKRVFSMDENNYETLIQMGDLYFAVGETEEAKLYYSIAVDVCSSDELFEKIRLCNEQLSRKYLDAFKDKPNEAINLLNYAEVISELGDYDKALCLLGANNFKEGSREYAWYLKLLGYIYFNLRDNISAYEYLGRSIILLENSAWENTLKERHCFSKIYGVMALICKQLRYKSRALEYIDKALSLGINTINLIIAKAKLYLEKRCFTEVIEQCELIHKQDDSNIEAYELEGDALKCLGKYTDSIRAYDRCLEINRNDYRVSMKKLDSMWELRDIDGMYSFMCDLRDAGYDTIDLAICDALTASRKNNPDKAVGLLRGLINDFENGTIILSDSDAANVYTAMGEVVYYWSLEKEEGLGYFIKALKYDPKCFGALKLLGICMGNMEQYKKGIKYYLQALSVKPNAINVMHNCANRYFALDEDSRALYYYSKLILIDPKYKWYSRRGNVYFYGKLYDNAIENYMIARKYLASKYNYLMIARAYTFSNREDEAVQYYKKALSINDGSENLDAQNAEITNYYIVNELKRNELDHAMQLCLDRPANISEFLRLKIDYCQGLVELKQEKFNEAVEKMKQSCISYKLLEFDLFDLLNDLVNTLCRAGKADEAEEYLEQCDKANVDNKERLDYYRLLLMFNTGRFEKFDVLLNKLVGIYTGTTDHVHAYEIIILKFMYHLHNKPDEKIEYNSEMMKKVIAKHKKNCTYYKSSINMSFCSLAAIEMEQGNFEKALEYVDKISKHRKCDDCKNKICTKRILIKGMIYELMGRYEDALENYELAEKYDKINYMMYLESKRLKEKMKNDSRN